MNVLYKVETYIHLPTVKPFATAVVLQTQITHAMGNAGGETYILLREHMPIPGEMPQRLAEDKR